MTWKSIKVRVPAFEATIEYEEPDKPTDPLPNPPSYGFDVFETVDGTLEGKRRWCIMHPNADVHAGIASGGQSYFSADGKKLAIYKRYDQTNGMWHMLDLATMTLTEVMERNNAGDVHENFIWGPTGHSYYLLSDRFLTHWNNNIGQLVNTKLPDRLLRPDGSWSERVQYRMYCGSGRSNPALTVLAGTQTAIMPFNAETLEYCHWWVSDAHHKGIDAGHALEPVADGIHNLACMEGGYAGAPQNVNQAVHHWYSQAGDDCRQIEPEGDAERNVITHQAFRGLLELSGDLRNQLTTLWQWKTPPQDPTAVWSMPKPQSFLTLFERSERNAVAASHVMYAHGDIGNEWAVSTHVDWGSPKDNRDNVLVKHHIASGQMTPVMRGIKYSENRDGMDADVYHAKVPRPSIAATGDWACYTEMLESGRVGIYVVEL